MICPNMSTSTDHNACSASIAYPRQSSCSTHHPCSTPFCGSARVYSRRRMAMLNTHAKMSTPYTTSHMQSDVWVWISGHRMNVVANPPFESMISTMRNSLPQWKRRRSDTVTWHRGRRWTWQHRHTPRSNRTTGDASGTMVAGWSFQATHCSTSVELVIAVYAKRGWVALARSTSLVLRLLSTWSRRESTGLWGSTKGCGFSRDSSRRDYYCLERERGEQQSREGRLSRPRTKRPRSYAGARVRPDSDSDSDVLA